MKGRSQEFGMRVYKNVCYLFLCFYAILKYKYNKNRKPNLCYVSVFSAWL